jgi:hypothetical protein
MVEEPEFGEERLYACFVGEIERVSLAAGRQRSKRLIDPSLAARSDDDRRAF